MSQIAVHDGVAYFAGIVTDNPTGDIREQTLNVLRKIDDLLASIGLSKEDVFSATIWLKDTLDFEAMNSVWDNWVSSEKPPVRACVGASLANPDNLIEIQITAALRSDLDFTLGLM